MPIHFACPLCGKQTVVSDQFAGQTGPCAACGGNITIPHASAASLAPTASRGSGGGSTLLVILAVLGVGCLICCGGLATFFFVARGQVLVRANRNLASNNLKQIGLALHNYHAMHNSFPPAVVTDENGNPLYSGRVLLLPFLEQDGLYNAFDKTKAWDAPENFGLSQAMIPTFQDPAKSAGSPSRTDFIFVTGKGTLFEGNKATQFARVTDGLSNTIAVVETDSGPDSWAAPEEWDADSGVFPTGNQPNRGLLVLYADGSIRFLERNYANQFARELVNISDGQVVPPAPP